MTVQDWGSCHSHGRPGPSFSPIPFLPGLASEEGRQDWQHSLYVSFSLPLCSASQINIETLLHTRPGVNPARDFPVRILVCRLPPSSRTGHKVSPREGTVPLGLQESGCNVRLMESRYSLSWKPLIKAKALIMVQYSQ